MNKEEAEASIKAGNTFVMGKTKDGKVGGPLSETALEFRLMFHRSISKFQKELPPLDKDWSYQIVDDDEPGPLKYLLYHFNNPTDGSAPGFMVVLRVGTYDVDTKEMLPNDQDKIIVFRFKTVDELLCQTNQS